MTYEFLVASAIGVLVAGGIYLALRARTFQVVLAQPLSVASVSAPCWSALMPACTNSAYAASRAKGVLPNPQYSA